MEYTEELKRFEQNNLFWRGVDLYAVQDKHLRDLSESHVKYTFPWTEQVTEPSVYVLYGGRQVGKTTSLKQFFLKLLTEKKLLPKDGFFLSCDSLVDWQELLQVLRLFISGRETKDLVMIAIDEATLIPDWHRAVKTLIDEGSFSQAIILITGSDRIVLSDAMTSFPGINRRGKYGKDFEIFPLSFREFLAARYKLSTETIMQSSLEILNNYLLEFLKTGGFLPAINSHATQEQIAPEIYGVYEQWIVGDFVRKGKDRRRLSEVLRVILETTGSQVSFTGLAHKTSGITTDTILDYSNHLERMGVIKVLHAFNQNTKGAFPKKDKRILFSDPFIAHSVARYLSTQGMYSYLTTLDEATLIETAVLSYLLRLGSPVFYMKAEGEIDFVLPQGDGFLPIEVKWTNQLRKEDLTQILKYPKQGMILSKRTQSGTTFEGVTIHAAAQFLAREPITRDLSEMPYRF